MVYYDYTYIYVALNGDIRVRHKRKVTIQNPISIPLALHLDVASRHMKFQKKPLIHASMIRNFFFHFTWL